MGTSLIGIPACSSCSFILHAVTGKEYRATSLYTVLLSPIYDSLLLLTSSSIKRRHWWVGRPGVAQ